MFPRPIGNYKRAVVTGVGAAVLLIPAVTATVRLLTGHRYPGLTPYVGLFLFMLMILEATFLLAFVHLLRTEHDLRAALDGTDSVAPPVLTQPDRQHALHDGETLALTRRMRTGGYWGYLGLVTVSAVFVVPLMTFCGEAIVYLALPHASGWILAWIFNRHGNLVIVPPPHLAPAEWIVVLIPAVATSV